MKTKDSFFILIFIITFLPNQLFSGWDWMNPKPTGNEMNSIFFLNENNGWCVGDCSTIIKTTDRGKNWIQCESPATTTWESIYFIDEKFGWLYGKGNIFKTTNGGITWLKQESGVTGFQIGYYYPHIYFINQNVGWIIGEHAAIQSRDGGSTWLKDTNNLQFMLKFVNDSVGFAICDSIIKKTTNQGIDWNPLGMKFNNPLRIIEFVDENIGWAIDDPYKQQDWVPSDSSFFYRTTDGGKTWNVLQNYADKIASLNFIDSLKGWKSNFGIYFMLELPYGTDLYYTTDGGINWENKFRVENERNNFKDIYPLNDNNCWLLTFDDNYQYYSIYKTKNNGNQWDTLTNNKFPVSLLKKVKFYNKDVGWIQSHWDFSLLYTSDGGKNWEDLESAIIPEDFYFVNENTGWLIRDYYAEDKEKGLYKTEDKGITWNLILSDTNSKYESLFFLNEIHGWFSSFKFEDGGTVVFFTSDGGQIWDSVRTNLKFQFEKLFFFNEIKGWAIVRDTNYYIFYTSNGGLSWNKQESGYTWEPLNDLFFTDENNGFIIGNYGILLRTIDGGENWKSIDIGTDTWLNSISFSDKQHGWIVGNGDEEIILTTDGGENWNVDSKKFCQALNSVCFKDSTTGWAVGDFGIILKYTTDAPITIEEHLSFPENNKLQIFPNPTNRNIKILFDLNESGIVEISLYSLKGNLIEIIKNLNFDSDQHQIDYNTQNLPSGEYFVILKFNGIVKSKKVVIVK